MNYKNYQNARDAAWRILVDCHVNRLPVQITAICKKLGVTVRAYEPQDDNDGMSAILHGRPIIMVSSHAPDARKRFTVAHELGHIILGHVGQYELCNREPAPSDDPIEQEANVFASRLLAPACVLWGCDAWDADSIMDLCGISRQAAEYRSERMAILRSRGKFLTSPLERKVYAQFAEFIADYKSTSGS